MRTTEFTSVNGFDPWPIFGAGEHTDFTVVTQPHGHHNLTVVTRARDDPNDWKRAAFVMLHDPFRPRFYATEITPEDLNSIRDFMNAFMVGLP